MEKLLSIDDLSEILGVKKATIYMWTSRNKIPYIKIGRRVLKFRARDIEDWLSRKLVDLEMPDPSHYTEKYRNRTKEKPKMSETYIDGIIDRAKEDVLK